MSSSSVASNNYKGSQESVNSKPKPPMAKTPKVPPKFDPFGYIIPYVAKPERADFCEPDELEDQFEDEWEDHRLLYDYEYIHGFNPDDYQMSE